MKKLGEILPDLVDRHLEAETTLSPEKAHVKCGFVEDRAIALVPQKVRDHGIRDKNEKALVRIYSVYPKPNFFRVYPDKTPRDRWKYGRPSIPKELLDWVVEGGRLGFVPGSVGLALLDVDAGDSTLLRGNHRERLALHSLSGRDHLYFDIKNVFSKGKWRHLGCSGDAICLGGYGVIYDRENGLTRIADAVCGREAAGRQLEFLFPADCLPKPHRDKPKNRTAQPKNETKQGSKRTERPIPHDSGKEIWWDGAKEGCRNFTLLKAIQECLTEKRKKYGQGSASLGWTIKVAIEINDTFAPPLPKKEVRATARSVYKSTERVRREWAAGGRRSGEVRLERVMERDDLVMNFNGQGWTHRQIGCLLFKDYSEDKARLRVKRILRSRRNKCSQNPIQEGGGT